ncbi:cytochrome c oxidase assembly protein [Xinfangfangia sp. D13-10-4-6]|uniref:cytochrome c oxidase assembly protein n=1 Tax=Pseudogemmobacter hezensis TaxID=2737662 RepID=UPI0015559490|nr:cytochrome c oxidase assembly protein [Pseudogemmobacter hezensis]NPD15214.1 cytochrome c oxidase assembly protein [Pseudogemmobacter hezensis]
MSSRQSLKKQKQTALALAAVVPVMLGLSFAAVPFYDWFCRVTGFGGTTGVAAEASTTEIDREITIRFDASKAAGMPWDFRPELTEMKIKIGGNGLAFYEAYNPLDVPTAGTASYNVAPSTAGGYFVKVHCFCFDQQVLQPGERVMMPVSFYVDPSIMDDPEGRVLKEITLSYTFHSTPLPEGFAAEVAPATTAVSAN